MELLVLVAFFLSFTKYIEMLWDFVDIYNMECPEAEKFLDNSCIY